MDLAKLATMLQALLGTPNMTLITSGTFVVRNERLECASGHLRVTEGARVIRIKCEQ